MVEETSVGVGIDVEISGLQREGAEVAQTFARIVAKIGEMSAALDDAVGKSNKLGQAFAKNAADVQKTTDELKEQVRVMKAQDAATKTDKYRILNQSSDNGGTLRDDQLRKFALGAQQTSLNMSQAQVEAQLKETVLKATQRLLTTTQAAITAAYNSTEFRVKQQIADFNTPSVVNARTVKTEAARIGMVQKYGSFDSGADYVARENAAKAEAAEFAGFREKIAAIKKRQAALNSEVVAEEKRFNLSLTALGRQASLQKSSEDAEFSVIRQKIAAIQKRENGIKAEVVAEEKRFNLSLTALARQASLQKNSEDAEFSAIRQKIAAIQKRENGIKAEVSAEEKRFNLSLTALGRQASLQKNSEDAEFSAFRQKITAIQKRENGIKAEAAAEEKRFNLSLTALGRQASLQKNSEDAEFSAIRQKIAAIQKRENGIKAEAAAEEKRSREAMNVAGKSAADVRNLETIRFNSNTSILGDARRAKQLETAATLQSKRDAGVADADLGKRTFGERLGARAELAGDYMAIGAMAYTAKAALTAVADLDDGLKKFQAITQTSNIEVSGFKENLLKLGEASRYSLKDLLEVSTTLGQTGLSAREVSKALPAVTALATASGSTLKEAVDIVTSVLGAYNMEAGRTAEVSNIMVSALNQTKLTMTQLQQGLSYSANIARDAGIGIAELTAILGGLAQAGIRAGSTLGTGTRQLIQDLVAPSDKLKNALKPLGITMADIDIKANGLVGVLDNMRAKGFGAAEAIGSLDLRAAAAFSALGGQVDVIKRLQESLLLSNSAAEGSSKANESLYASFTRLGNAMVGTLDRGMAPIVEGLKLLTGAATGAFSILNQLGPALGIVGAAFGAAALGGGILAAVTGFKALTAAIIGVNTAMMKNPLFLAVTGAVFAAGVIVATKQWIDSLYSVEARLDRVKSKLNELQGDQTKTEQQISSIDAMILSSIERRERLNSDPLLRRAAIVEAQEAFKDLGLSIKANSNNIDEMIDALRRLRGELAKELPSTIEKRIKALDDQTTLLLENDSKSRLPTASRKIMENQASKFGLSSNVRGPLDFLSMEAKDIDTTDVRGTTAPLIRQLMEMKNSNSGNQTVTALADKLIDLIDTRAKGLQGVQVNNINKEGLRSQANVDAVEADPRTQRLMNARTDAFGRMREEMRGIEANTGLGAAARADAYFDLLKKMTTQSREAIDEVNGYAKELEASGYDPQAIQKALGKIVDLYVALGTGTVSPEMSAMKLGNVAKDEVAREKLKSNTTQIAADMVRARNSNNVDEIAVIEGRVNALLEQSRLITMEITKRADSDISGRTQSVETRGKLEEQKEQAEANQRRFTEQLLEIRKNVIDTVFGLEISSGKKQEASIRAEITNVEKELARSSTTKVRAKELMDKLEKLFADLGAVLDNRVNLEANRDRVKQYGGGVPSSEVTPGSVQDQMVQWLRTNGYGDQLTGTAFKFAQMESSFNPNAKADTSSAEGLMQFLKGTWDSLGGGDIRSVNDQMKNFVKYLGQIDSTFERVLGRRPSTDFERYLGWQQGPQGGANLLKADPNTSAASIVGADALTNNRIAATATVGEFLVQMEQKFNAASSAAGKYLKTTDATIEERAAAERAANATRTKTELEAAREKQATNEYQRVARENATSSRADEKDFQSKKAGIANAYTADDASKIAAEMVGILAALRDKELATLKLSEAYRRADGDPVKQKELEDDVRRRYSERMDKDAQGWSAAIAQKVTEEQKAVVDKLTTQKDQLEKSGRPTAVVERQLAIEQEKLNIVTPILEKEREILEIKRLIDASTANGVATEGQLGELLGKKVALEKELLQLKQKQTLVVEASRLPTFGEAFTAGSDSYFKQAGMMDSKNQFKTDTQMMSGYWAQAMGSMQNGLSSLFTNLASGTMKASEAFKKFAVSVIESMLKIASEAASKEIMKLLFSGLTSTGGASGGGILETAGKAVAGLFGAASYQGGLVRMAGGGPVPTRDSVNIYAQPGEYLLRKSAVDMIGRDQLDYVNGMGNRVNSAHAPRQMPSPAAPRKPDNVNVYVVSPDQQPVPGAKDIVAHISSDIQNRGQTFQLIRQVAIGGV